jgi:hypothetical protein
VKRLTTLLFVLLALSAGAFAQKSGASNWGNRILLGTKFFNTDSTRLMSNSLRDTVLADTLYSGLLYIDDQTEGIYRVAAFLTNVGGTSDSISVDVRLCDVFKDGTTTTFKWGAWQSVLNVIDAGAIVDTVLDPSTATWWQAASGRQYRVYDESVTTDTTNHLLSDYVR